MGKPSGLAAWFLLAANLVLLSVVWIVSIKAYGRLPQDMASWSSVFAGAPRPVERSGAFFLYPTAQIIFFAAALSLAEVLFVRRSKDGGGMSRPSLEKTRRLIALKREVAYLSLIFVNLLFIHLQTTRILLSHKIGDGINKIYLAALILMIVFILGPYHRIRRKILLTERTDSSEPR